MRFFFITNSADMARLATDSGADRIFVDLEILGKVERQGHLNTVISRHQIADVATVRKAVPNTELLVRLNPFYSGSENEINAAIDAGADVLMLPMFRTIGEVEGFAGLIADRCRLSLLVETKEAMEQIGNCASVEGVTEVHIGLNDLSLDLGLKFMFAPFSMGLIDRMAAQLIAVGKPFGIGGLARADEGLLPARLVMGEHVRVGSTAAILSRTFYRDLDHVDIIKREPDFAREISVLRKIERDYRNAPPSELEANRAEVCRLIRSIEAQRAENRI